MAGDEVGRLKVRVLPGTRRFKEDLKKSLDRIERQVRANVEVTASLSRASLAELRRQIEALDSEVRVAVDASGVRRQVEAATRTAKASVKVTPDFQRGMFHAQLATLLRPRELDVHVKMRGGMRAFGALSGMSTLNRLSGEFLDTVRNLDRTMPRLARNATLLATTSAGVLAGLSNALGIAQGLARIAPLMLVAPAAVGALVVGMSIIKTAMQDAGQYIGDLQFQFNDLRSSISGGFWSTAESGVRRFTSAIMPLSLKWLPQIAAEIGALSGAIAGAFETPRGQGNLSAFFSNMSTMVGNARTGVGQLTSGLLELVGAGSQYLPRLGSAFSQMAADFNSWATSAVDSGRFFMWVDRAIANLKALGGVVSATSGILSGLASAASAAGAAGLPELAAGLERVNRAVNSPVWQGALTTVFAGAHAAMRNLSPGVSALGDAFIVLAPTIARIMDLASQVANVALVALAGAIQNPAFTSGLTSFFDGVLVGMQGFAPAVELIVEKLGTILELAGVFAAHFGPLLAGAMAAMAPVIPELTAALGALIPVLSDGLLSAIQAVAPFIIGLVTAISDWIQANPQLAATALVVAAAVGAVVAVVIPAITAFASIVGAVMALVGVFGAMPVIIGGAIAAVVAILVGLVAAVVANWNEISAWWSEGMGSIQQQAKDGWAAISAWWSESLGGLGRMLSGAWTGFLESNSARLGEMVGFFAALPGRITGALGDLSGLLLGAGRAIMDGLLGGLRDAWGGVKNFVGGIGPWIAQNKGPLSYDARLLIPAGRAIMGGLDGGLRDRFGSVRSTVLGIAPMIAQTVARAASHARAAGSLTGEQIAVGLESEARRVQSAMDSMMPAVSVQSFQLDVAASVEEERRYHAEVLGGIIGPAVSNALDGAEVRMDGRRTLGALRTSRAWRGS